jgi:hypothetical protein
VFGAALYVVMKIFGLCLVPVIFELTREKLLALPWFAFLYEKFEALHAMARRFVAPYRERALELAGELVAPARSVLRRWRYRMRRSAARPSAAKADTLASSARAVGSRPASPSH